MGTTLSVVYSFGLAPDKKLNQLQCLVACFTILCYMLDSCRQPSLVLLSQVALLLHLPLLLQTSVNGVYAIGDVAAFPLLAADAAIVRQEHVTHARSSAAQAAKAIMGETYVHAAKCRPGTAWAVPVVVLA
jgi:hypothetical protein